MTKELNDQGDYPQDTEPNEYRYFSPHWLNAMAEGLTMTKKERYDAIEKACKDFRDENLRTLQNGDRIEMLLPMLYDDNDGACVFITPQELTMPEIRELCMRYDYDNSPIQFDDMPDYEQTPFECEIYKVVHIDDLDKAVWRIIMLIRDSYEYVMARRIISRIKQR